MKKFIPLIFIATILLCSVPVMATSSPTNIARVDIALNGTTLEEINSGSKDTKYPGNTVKITKPDGTVDVLAENTVEVKGRGNSTWKMPKKPYQIKFSSKTKVLGMAKQKKWCLLANYLDGSMMRNKLVYDMGREMGLTGSPDSQFVDLYVDGEYQGAYLLCQKIDAGSSGCNLGDDGIIVELDNMYYAEEDYWFKGKYCNGYFTLKECNNEDNQEAIFDAFKSKVDSFETALYAKNKDWETISSYINEESFAKMYLIFDYTQNVDGMYSSTYFTWDGDEIKMGPVWDFDRAMGNHKWSSMYNVWMNYHPDKQDKLCSYFEELVKIPEFRQLVRSYYADSFKDVIDNAYGKISAYEGMLTPSATLNEAKWHTYSRTLNASMKMIPSSYAGCVSELRTWMDGRRVYEGRVQGILDVERIRLSGATRYDTTLKCAEEVYNTNGPHDTIILANGEGFADALTGTALSKAKGNAPIILINDSSCTKITTYIKNHINNGGKVYILGGTSAISSKVESAVKTATKGKSVTVKRLGGATRYETNMLILTEAGLQGEEVLICNGTGYADSLSASSTGLPIMLVGDTITAKQLSYLKAYNPSKVTILGGTGAVSESVEKALKSYNPERCWGMTRYSTSVAIAHRYFSDNDVVTYVNGEGFADGLSASAVAAINNSPVILVSNSSTAYASSYTKSIVINKSYVVGGQLTDTAISSLFI